MTRIVWSPQSLQDLEVHRDFIAQDSPQYADLTVRRIVAAVERLEQFPLSGRVVPERRSLSLREVIVGRLRVVYRVSSGTVEIVTVFRGEQSFPHVE